MPAHREIQPEEIAVDHVDIARLRSSESVDAPVEGLIGTYLNSDSSVFAVDRHWNQESCR